MVRSPGADRPHPRRPSQNARQRTPRNRGRNRCAGCFGLGTPPPGWLIVRSTDTMFQTWSWGLWIVRKTHNPTPQAISCRRYAAGYSAGPGKGPAPCARTPLCLTVSDCWRQPQLFNTLTCATARSWSQVSMSGSWARSQSPFLNHARSRLPQLQAVPRCVRARCTACGCGCVFLMVRSFATATSGTRWPVPEP